MTSRGVLRLTGTLLYCAVLARAATVDDAQTRAAAWLSAELHRPVAAQQVRSAPEIASFTGCRLSRISAAQTGGSSIELRCAPPALRQIVLVDLAFPQAGATRPDNITSSGAHRARPLVRAGARLRADWRTPSMHAVLPVLALEPGADGAEIRVRLTGGKRIYHARVLNAHAVEILREGT